MGKRTGFFNYIIFSVFCLVGGLIYNNSAHAGVNDFYFSDFTGDYYLSSDENGISHLRVVESVTAVFPDYDQNKGICRQIPYTNQDGKNITLSDLTRQNLTLTRNGAIEPIYSITKEGNYYNVCTGSEEYVRGEQTYVFEYEFSKVVTDFSDYQEIYWDTNGNGSTQAFSVVTARVHFEDDNVFTGKSWCYVGSYGESGQDRCTISEIGDGMEFVAKNLKRNENLTFDVELKAGSFVVPEARKDYTYVWLTLAVVALSGAAIAFFAHKYIKTREKESFYKGLFVKPEYQPHKEYGLTEMAEIYFGKKKDVKVAMLLEMVTKREIELKKAEKKGWEIVVKKEVNGEYGDLLAILNGGTQPAVGDVIKVQRRTADSKLIALKKAMENKILAKLTDDKLVEEKYRIGSGGKRGILNVIVMTIVIVPLLFVVGVFLMGALDGMLGLNEAYGVDFVFSERFYLTVFIITVVTVIVCVYLSDRTQRYAGHTKKGLEAARYMEGLELYIKMAEADRLKMLQSVEGADTSAEGIVKLYEKLLPYAAIFGLEKSWMDEMRKYCEVEEVSEPDYLVNGLAAAEISRGLSRVASYATASTTMSSSGGGSSSGFSGGGGGGFSGGGGGGGGFSGR